MALVEDFKKFALKGNVLDLAVAVIMGGAFGKIVTGLVDNLIMPLVSVAMPNPEWKTANFPLKEVVTINDKGETVKTMAKLTYGALLGNIVDFLVIAIILFMIVQAANKAMKKKEEAAAVVKSEVLLEEIRDLLKKQQDGAAKPAAKSE